MSCLLKPIPITLNKYKYMKTLNLHNNQILNIKIIKISKLVFYIMHYDQCCKTRI